MSLPLTSRKLTTESRKHKLYRPYFLSRPRAGLSSCFPAARPNRRARGTPGVQLDPRASTPRDIEACRSPVVPCLPPWFGRNRKASRKSAKPMASRARCLIGLLRALPGGRLPRRGETLAATFHRLWAQALGERSCDGSTYPPTGHHGPPACGSARRKQRGLGRRVLAPHLRCKGHISRPPLPAPRLETLIRHPFGTGAGYL